MSTVFSNFFLKILIFLRFYHIIKTWRWSNECFRQ
nr:MAG TPA: Nrap protein PAP/OAS1-like domain 5 [Caudoviricetes sp.]